MFFLMALGVYLVVLPLVEITVSAKSELMATTRTSPARSGRASPRAGTLHLIRQPGRRQRLDDERLRLTREIHQLLHAVHGARLERGKGAGSTS